jgi:hypothetical protein
LSLAFELPERRIAGFNLSGAIAAECQGAIHGISQSATWLWSTMEKAVAILLQIANVTKPNLCLNSLIFFG